jgi:DNA-binding transcriptional LysR family regulator
MLYLIRDNFKQTNFIDTSAHHLCWMKQDIELPGIFLEIVSTGGFVRASERLNVGQTTMSARMRLLEQQLGRSLFVRNKSGAALPGSGFAVYANVRATVAAGA